jgi:hypothetical protein
LLNPEIASLLVKRGEELFNAHPKHVIFTNDPSADALLNDLDRHPHAFVLACVMDRQIKAERAWLIPYEISQAIGGFSFELLRELSLDDFRRLLREPKVLHRFPEEMPKASQRGPTYCKGIRRQRGTNLARLPVERGSCNPVPAIPRCRAKNRHHGREHSSQSLQDSLCRLLFN